ncbi:hypothetical protein RG47T_2777 [Mucilaginibacter polytrichastri]|uniref:Sialate O-acetylesterase domain-containing protein n=1 Tax=Mucilaginibacter polytrichastri TaxID=1302689 RepID=A0A1Q5ZZY8_9SPHI|nr:hypothetical protein RG47T_2777 [Mucilaginibacter polytrichastri]
MSWFLLTIPSAYAQVSLPKLVSDNMVLQRDTKIKLWGWAGRHEKVTIKFNNKTGKAITGDDGKWMILLPVMKAGGPYTMEISASNHITIRNILIGDVWFCSGQSNMVINMERVKERYPEDIAQANYPEIRNFFIPTVADVRKVHDELPASEWKAATPTNTLNFGAASYFFARKLYLKYHVPIGIINASVGGTPIEAWISEGGLKQFPEYQTKLANFKDSVYMGKLLAKKDPPIKKPEADKGLTGPVKWYDTTYVPQGWHKFWLPGYWADQGVKGLNGTVWFRKEINIPASMTGTPAKLFMGRIIDADQAYVNGVLVGGTTYQYPPRRYDVAQGLLKPGKNIIVVRVVNTAGKGGFVPEKPYFLSAGGQNIDLRGDWQYQVGEVFETQWGAGSANNFSAQNEPAGLYNTMVAPVINYAVKGFVWYQGESNTAKPQAYQYLLPALISDWRSKWNNVKLPFIYAQLPNFMEVQYSPSESQWAEMRESQLKALAVPNTAMSVNIDAGEWNDIHPLDKKDVGERLALGAEKLAYHDETVVLSGPIYQSAKIEGNKITLTFNNIGSGLAAKDGGELQYFAIAGKNKKYVWAKARIEGNTVVVWNDDITEPLYVRYAWADNPEGANLYNKDGLPASPFTTDTQ